MAVFTCSSVICIEDGTFDVGKQQFDFKINGKQESIGLREPKLPKIKDFIDSFGDAGKALDDRKIECGSFNFSFFVFDFSAQAPMKYKLDRKDKDTIKAHRIYL